MRFPAYSNWKQYSTTIAAPAATTTTNNAVQFTLARKQLRLEAVLVEITGTTATHTTPTSDALANLAKRIRLRVNDSLSSRNAVDVSGPGTLSYCRQNDWRVGRDMQEAISRLTTQVGAFKAHWWVPIRPPGIQEPAGNYFSIPLDRLNEDPVIEVDLGSVADIGATLTLTGTLTCNLHFKYRNTPTDFLYIPTQLRTDQKTWDDANSTQTWDIPADGFLTQLLMQHYQSATARGAVLNSATDQWILKQGLYDRQAWTDSSLQSLNDQSQMTYPEGAFCVRSSAADPAEANLPNFSNEGFLDFLSDTPGTDAFSVNSIIDLRDLSNRASIVGDKIGTAGTPQTQFTYHKILPRRVEDLGALTQLL